MVCGAAMDPLLRAQARSGGLHRQAKVWRGAARAVMLRAAVVEAAPSGQAEVAGHIKICLRWLSRGLRLASRLCTSTYGSTT
jgi:hypothetical protein